MSADPLTDLSFRDKPDVSPLARVFRIAYYLSELYGSRALLERGGVANAAWTCIELWCAVLWHAMLLEADGLAKVVTVHGHKFGSRPSVADAIETLLKPWGTLYMATGWAGGNTKDPWPVARGVLGCTSMPHVFGIDKVLRSSIVGDWEIFECASIEGGQTNEDWKIGARTWKLVDGEVVEYTITEAHVKDDHARRYVRTLRRSTKTGRIDGLIAVSAFVAPEGMPVIAPPAPAPAPTPEPPPVEPAPADRPTDPEPKPAPIVATEPAPVETWLHAHWRKLAGGVSAAFTAAWAAVAAHPVASVITIVVLVALAAWGWTRWRRARPKT